MNKIITIIILLFCCASLPSFAQRQDSLLQKSDNVVQKLSSKDSIGSTYQNKVDSLSALKLPGNKYQKKLDSIRNGFSVEKLLSKGKLKRDSLSSPSIQSDSSFVKNKRKEVDSLKLSLAFKIDSIKAKGGDASIVQ